jgi:hypothetical protein
MDPIGFDLDGLFHRLPNTIKPLTKECYALHIYQGPYYECSKNRRLGTIELPYREIWDLSYCINEDTCSVLLENKEILKVNMSTCNMEYEKEADGRWYETQTPKLEYIEYIREHKSTLYDHQIKFSIERLVPGYPTYLKLMEKFERAEQLCFIDVSPEEYKAALKEIQFFVEPIMRQIVKKYT